MPDHSNKPKAPAKADAEFDRRVRTGIGVLPLPARQEWAGQMAYSDGRPLSGDEVRQYIRRERGAGTGREDVRKTWSSMTGWPAGSAHWARSRSRSCSIRNGR